MFRKLLLVFIQLAVAASLQASPAVEEITDLPGDISTALSQGDTKTVARHFNSSVQVILLNREGMYNDSQAELILKNFFSQHQPTSFDLRHEGGSETRGSRFLIGTLYTKSGTYRVSLFIKSIDGNMKIHQVRVEDDND